MRLLWISNKQMPFAYDEADVAFSALRVAIGSSASRAIGTVEPHYDIPLTRGG